jgi:hypothetical protein
LNGVVVGPGEVLSFNRSVGPRSAERGFSEAPVIVADELERGLGGGVCQVASTLFGAAMLGGFEIVKRRSHSRPSGYAPLGLDAVVIYDENVDLQLRNPYESPVIVHAFFRTKGSARGVPGREPPGKVQTSPSTNALPFTRRVAIKPDLPRNDRQASKGSQGYDGTSTLVIERPDGTRLARTTRASTTRCRKSSGSPGRTGRVPAAAPRRRDRQPPAGRGRRERRARGQLREP